MAKYTLDVTKRGRQFTIEGLHVGDNGFRTFVFCFIMGGAPFPLPEGCIATLFAYLPGGVTVYDSCTVLGDMVVYNLVGGDDSETSITSVPGIVECEIRITSQSGEVLTSPKFSMLIDSVLQDDNAIAAQPSFSALTDALIRVLEAENGLSSKVDKVDGTPGNLVVFGEDGALKDGGKIPEGGGGNIASYVFVYDSEGTREYDEANKQSLESLIAAVEEGKHISVYIDYDGTLLPGAFDNGDAVASIFPNGNGYVSIRKMTNRIVYSEKDNYSGSFSETGIIPASQKATAEWVKALIETSITEGAW